jgi:hypothetical protein
MAARGREEARERTAGRRKVKAVRLDTHEEPRIVRKAAVPPFPEHWGPDPSGATCTVVSLTGECGHVLARAEDGTPAARRLLARVGHRVTCPHDGCRIPEHVYTDADCEYITGIEVERRCTTRARWDTEMGKVCTRHRNHYAREGYIDSPGIPVTGSGDEGEGRR